MPLVSPYKHIPHPQRKLLVCYVDPHDIVYLERIFPMQTGLNDRVLGNLFHAFILHLKSIEPKNPNATDTTALQSTVPGLTPTLPHETAWYLGCPTYTLLDILIANINFHDIDAVVAERLAAGRAAGTGCDNALAGATDPIRPTLCPPEKQCAKPQGSTGKGRGGKAGSKTKDKEKGQRGNGLGVSLAD